MNIWVDYQITEAKIRHSSVNFKFNIRRLIKVFSFSYNDIYIFNAQHFGHLLEARVHSNVGNILKYIHYIHTVILFSDDYSLCMSVGHLTHMILGCVLVLQREAGYIYAPPS